MQEQRLRSLLALSVGVSLALAAACVLLLRAERGRGPAGLDDPELAGQVVRALIEETPAGLDSHPDPAVAYVLLAGKTRDGAGGESVTGSAIGMREAEYALPKPPDTLRVVLLGDSYVFGLGVAAEQRLGVHLQGLVAAAAEPGRRVEVLHLGISGWNLAAECAWLRRQLEALRPDLVLHFTADNDLSDAAGVRGFGALATFTPQHRERATGRIHDEHPLAMGFTTANLLHAALDHESRARLDAAFDAVVRLRADVEAAGGRYVLVANWGLLNPIVQARFGEALGDRLVALPLAFVDDPGMRISAADRHWSAEGHARLARMLFGLAGERGLLALAPSAELDAARAEAREFFAAGRAEAERDVSTVVAAAASALRSAIDFAELDATAAAQVHGGIDADGIAAPYASLLLRRAGDRLVVAGSDVSTLVLRGARVRVCVDGIDVGTLELGTGEPLALDVPLPAGADARFVTVSFTADDFVYRGDNLRGCAAFRLALVAIR